MEDSLILEQRKKIEKLNDKEYLLLAKRRNRITKQLFISLYLGGILLCFKLSISTFVTFVNESISIGGWSIYLTSIVAMSITFFKSLSYFLFFSFIIGLVLLLINMITNKDRDKEIKIWRKLKNGRF